MSRCACPGCASGRYGSFTALLHAAQADQDKAHRQLAMTQLAAIGPMAGGNGTPAADAMAKPVLDQLYPGSEDQVHHADPQQQAESLPAAVPESVTDTDAERTPLDAAHAYIDAYVRRTAER